MRIAHGSSEVDETLRHEKSDESDSQVLMFTKHKNLRDLGLYR
jgi:hypothetical protein